MNPFGPIALEGAQTLVDAITRLGQRHADDEAALATYIEERQGHLASIHGEPGYREAVEAEAVNVALFAVGQDIARADASAYAGAGLREPSADAWAAGGSFFT